jgi:hypothetical protein
MHIPTYIYACVYRLSRLSRDSWLSYAWLTRARVQWADRDLVGVLAGAFPTNGSLGLPLPLPYIYILPTLIKVRVSYSNLVPKLGLVFSSLPPSHPSRRAPSSWPPAAPPALYLVAGPIRRPDWIHASLLSSGLASDSCHRPPSRSPDMTSVRCPCVGVPASSLARSTTRTPALRPTPTPSNCAPSCAFVHASFAHNRQPVALPAPLSSPGLTSTHADGVGACPHCSATPSGRLCH